MNEHDERVFPVDATASPGVGERKPEALLPAHDVAVPEPQQHTGETTADEAATPATNGSTAADQWHARAGRKGAHRLHELIREGKLYEEEHGLKSGRQRLRQLIELGKVYEEEHGLRPTPKRKRKRFTRGDREELLATLLQCLVRIAKPSFRAELTRLIEALTHGEDGHAA